MTSITITWTTSGGGSTTTATTTTIDASGITNTDVYTGTAAGSLTATVTETESGNPVSGATVTWTSSDEGVATIDENGVVTLVAAGTTTITASYAGVSGEFGASSATYELTVTSSAPYVQPTTIEITPNYEFWGQTEQFSGSTYDNLSGEKDNVTLEWSRGSGSTYANTTAMRFYKDNTLTFTAPDGYEIKSIEFTYTQTQNDLTFSPDGYNSTNNTWTGSSSTVTMSRPSNGSSYYQITKITITLGLPSTDPAINASNVNIAYDATQGEIAYTITNPVTGKTLQATADATWVSSIIVNDDAINFTTTANDSNTERVATFTLTYEGAEDKTVTVTQAAAPVVYTTIPALFAAATSTSTPVTITFNNWVISAVKGSNAYLTDNAGNGLIIYQSSHGFNVNNVLSGTANCNLVTYQGSAELTALTASTEGLTVTAGGTVTEQNIAINELGGVNTGALLAYQNLTYNGTALVDADNNAIEPYTTLYSGTFEADKVYNVKGIYKQYTTTTQEKKQILPRSADDIEEVVSDEPSITVNPNPMEVSGTANSGTLEVTYNKVEAEVGSVEFLWCNADGSTPASEDYSQWLNANLDDTDVTVINYMVGDNDGPARTAYFKIYGLAEVSSDDVFSEVVSFTQGAFVSDYAFLPFEFTGGKSDIENTNGLTHNGLGNDYSDINSKLKFDGTGDYLVLKVNPDPGYVYAPKAITFNIKGNGFSDGTFAVQVSEDGATYTDLATYTDSEITSSNQTFTLLNTNDNVKYIKWIYTNKVNGNVGLGNIYVDEEYLVRGNATVSEDLTLIACEIRSEGKLTIESGATFTVTEPYALYNGGNSSNLVIKDGGQLKTPNEVFATVEKDIIGYTEANYYTNKGYYLVSAPAEKYLNVAQDNTDVDAYMFDASQEGKEWRNFKGAQGAWNISASSAILYATKENSTLSLDGQGIVYNDPNPGANPVANKVPATTTNIDIDIEFNGGKAFEGYNLIGNPFTCDAYINRDYYRMNAAGDAIVPAASATTAIKPCEGIFVVAANTSDNTVTFTTTAPSTSSAPANVVINLKDSEMVRDRAIVSFDGERDMPRFQFNDAAAKLYIPEGEKEMAKVSSEAQGEMPVNFKADKNGSFTLNVDAANLDVDYLHLIDNLTGADVDLLQTPSYTFDARTSDYASRFRLVFSVNNVPENEDSHSTFAYFNGSEWVINASDNATVQVVDVMGRVILNSDAKHGVSTANMPAGVYMLRLVNGNNVKVQKIVVR